MFLKTLAPPMVTGRRANKSFWKLTLMLMAVMLVFTGCEEHKEEITLKVLLDGRKLSNMTSEELTNFFDNIDMSDIKPGHDEFHISKMSPEEFAAIPRLKTRATYTCDMDVSIYLDSPADSADVTVLYAGTSNIFRAKERVADGDFFTMTIDGGDFYDFKIENPNNPTGSISGSIELEPHWGVDDLEFFSGSGPHYVEDYNFECPAPTNGTCQASANIRQISGTATDYTVVVLENGNYHDVLTGFTGNPSQYKYYDIDETNSYTFISQADNGTSEDYSLRIVRPDATALSYYYYGRSPLDGATTPAISSFNCPY